MAKSPAEIDALGKILQILEALDERARNRILNTVDTFFGRRGASDPGELVSGVSTSKVDEGKPYSEVQFSKQTPPSPKAFLLEKQPQTDVERVACLAFYLAHFRDMPHFKTVDISKLNSEAAQLKLSNTAYAVSNAKTAGYITGATKGSAQISAAGERFVLALPDRERAKSDMAAATFGRRGKSRQARRKK